MKKLSFKNTPIALAALGAALLLGSSARAADASREPEGVVTLSSSATVEVPKDWMSVTFSTTKEGADAAAVQAALKDALDAALAQARRAARPDGHVEVQTGGFSLQPRFDGKGRMTGWSGSAELQVQGRDLSTIAELAGQVATMSVARLGFDVSREAREKAEGELAAQAIARFRAKAADYAKAFGYAGFAIREVNVQSEASAPPMPRIYAMKAMASSAMDAPLPVEAGNGTLSASVNGTVQMK